MSIAYAFAPILASFTGRAAGSWSVRWMWRRRGRWSAGAAGAVAAAGAAACHALLTARHAAAASFSKPVTAFTITSSATTSTLSSSTARHALLLRFIGHGTLLREIGCAGLAVPVFLQSLLGGPSAPQLHVVEEEKDRGCEVPVVCRAGGRRTTGKE